MGHFNIKLFLYAAVVIMVLTQPCQSYREISGLLDDAKDLSRDEINALRPLFQELQLQYDFIVSKIAENGNKVDEKFEREYQANLNEFEQQFNEMFPQEATTVYDITLPTAEDIMGKPDFNSMTHEQQIEFLDMQSILQDTLDEAQMNLKELVSRALLLETKLIKINKPKIVMFILNALHIGYVAAGRVGRAAYCTYSNIPQLNTSLHSLYEGVDCYLYTTSLIVQIQNEIYKTVMTIKKNVFELAAVYKKVADKNSILGKIVSSILSVTKVARSISETIRTAEHVMDNIENQLPVAAQQVVNCGTNFATKIPFMIETVSNVTECILFIDDTGNDYDFMKPEDEYYKLPQDLPFTMEHDDDVDDDDLGDSK